MKLIASDYDGTFYTNDFDIKINIKTVKNFRKENIFVLATGRSYTDATLVIDKYHIPYDYLIINHGATIIKDKKIIYNKQLDNSLKNKLIIDLKKRSFIQSYGYDGVNDNHLIEDNNLVKLYIKYKTPKDVKYIDKILRSKYLDKINFFWMHNNMVVEIVSKEVDKANAIKEIARLENISDDDIYTIGDNTNDIIMLKNFNGFAISNAKEEIKKLGLKEYPNVYMFINDVMNNKM